MGREAKAYFALDPSLGAVYRDMGARLIAIDDRVLKGLTDYALFLRGVRAERDPAPRGIRRFTNAKSLLADLKKRAAA